MIVKLVKNLPAAIVFLVILAFVRPVLLIIFQICENIVLI